MQQAHAIDTHRYIKKLEDVGVSSEQAEVTMGNVAEIVSEGVASKGDMRELGLKIERDIKALELRVTIRMGIMFGSNIAILGTLIAIF